MSLWKSNNDKLFFLSKGFKIWNCESGQKVFARLAGIHLKLAGRRPTATGAHETSFPPAIRNRRVKVNRLENSLLPSAEPAS